MVVGAGVTSMGEFVASSVSYSGTLNKAFGGGFVATDVTGEGWQQWPNACAVDSDGKLLSGGQCIYETGKGKNLTIGQGFALVRYDTNGALDTTFNKTGIVKTNFKFDAAIKAIVLQASGSNENIVVAGGYSTNGSPIVLARYTSSGVLDSTFGSGGTLSTASPALNTDVQDVALQSDGSIVVGAEFFSSSELASLALIRYTANGKLDTTFGSNGIVTLAIGNQNTHLNGITIDANDNIVVAGDCDGDMVLARFTADGDLDATFANGNGYVTESFASTACAAAIDGAGNIVVSGVSGVCTTEIWSLPALPRPAPWTRRSAPAGEFSTGRVMPTILPIPPMKLPTRCRFNPTARSWPWAATRTR